MKERLRLVIQPSTVKRSLIYALVVGAILIAINHGAAILRGNVTPGQLCQMALTVLVPYVVSTLSSVGALLESRRQNEVSRLPIPGGPAGTVADGPDLA